MVKTQGKVRVAALGDIHLGRAGYGPRFQAILAEVSERADVLALCGDLTDRGEPEEARQLARALSAAGVPVVAVLGNHDHESGKAHEVSGILCDSGVHVLDGEAVELHGVGFAGAKGFCGGFGRRALGPWGEEMIKLFVREAVNEALKLESALGRLRSRRRVALLHYSPIAGTVEGEPLELYPYLGSSRLEEPISRYQVDAVFHGHAHHGTLEGRTLSNVPVYNVSMALLERVSGGNEAFKVIELSTDAEPGGTAEGQEAPPDERAERRGRQPDRRAQGTPLKLEEGR